MPSLAAKNANTWEMKYRSSSFKDSQCWRSLERSTCRGRKSVSMATFALRNSQKLWTQPIPNMIYLFSGPKRGLCLLVHLPDVMVLNGEDDKATWIFLQKRLFLNTSFVDLWLLQEWEKISLRNAVLNPLLSTNILAASLQAGQKGSHTQLYLFTQALQPSLNLIRIITF